MRCQFCHAHAATIVIIDRTDDILTCDDCMVPAITSGGGLAISLLGEATPSQLRYAQQLHAQHVTDRAVAEYQCGEITPGKLAAILAPFAS